MGLQPVKVVRCVFDKLPLIRGQKYDAVLMLNQTPLHADEVVTASICGTAVACVDAYQTCQLR